MTKEKATKPLSFALPKDAVKKADLGASFAEYDIVRKNPDLFVETSAIRAASNPENSKSIFVGRRGTGKTAVTYFLTNKDPKTTVLLLPQIFSIVDNLIGADGSTGDVHQRPFKTLVNCIKRSLLNEVVSCWIANGFFTYRQNQSSEISRNRGDIEDIEFDNRVLEYVKESWGYLDPGRERDWNRFDSRVKKLQTEVESEGHSRKQIRILIDRIDEDWNGSESAVTMLMAMLHACIQLNAILPHVKFMTFIRENMFDRVRQADKEFSRIETAVVSLEWTKEQLRELIERRLRRHLITKPALNGPAWQAFFQSVPTQSSEDIVFDYCQFRPREVLTYCSFALENAQSRNQSQIGIQDLYTARTRFSESRLKEISDEYAENYPGLGTVLASFFGLGKRFTYKAIDDFIKKLLVNKRFAEESAKWVYRFTFPESFMTLLYSIGFAGIQDKAGILRFRLHETQPVTPADITSDSLLVIHETYVDALQLQNKLVPSIDEAFDLRLEGLIADLPEAFNAEEYKKKIDALRERLTQLPKGKDHAGKFEDFIGEVISLCFYRTLSNFEPKSRTYAGTTVKDWVAGVHASSGFWQMIRDRYKATQVVFECKNYEALSVDDFHQANYYMNDTSGKFVIIIARFTKDLKRKYYEHIRGIVQAHSGNAMLLVLGEWNLHVLLRQALNGKNNEPHLQEIYDRTVRLVSST